MVFCCIQGMRGQRKKGISIFIKMPWKFERKINKVALFIPIGFSNICLWNLMGLVLLWGRVVLWQLTQFQLINLKISLDLLSILRSVLIFGKYFTWKAPISWNYLLLFPCISGYFFIPILILCTMVSYFFKNLVG